MGILFSPQELAYIKLWRNDIFRNGKKDYFQENIENIPDF